MTEIRSGPVAVLPPKERAGEVALLRVWLVQVVEPDPPPGEEGLEWLLLSSEGAATAEWAERIVSWYERRWGLEEYFRLLKTGTRIEDRRLRDAKALGKCLVVDAITAWRVFSLERYARDAPDTPAAEVLTADELAVIEDVTEAERSRPPRHGRAAAALWGPAGGGAPARARFGAGLPAGVRHSGAGTGPGGCQLRGGADAPGAAR